jgi:hypothetical protein
LPASSLYSLLKKGVSIVKHTKSKLILGALLLTSCGCSSMNNTEAGALGGGVIGGALGTVVGAAARNPLAGAAIGAATGAAIGGLAGHEEDRAEKRIADQQAAYVAAAQQQAARAPTYQEIVQMTRNGVPEGNIIAQIRNSGAAYNINADDITYLSQNGVSSNVILELQSRVPGRVYATAPVVYQYGRPVYVYDPPPVSVGVGVGYYRHW